MPDLYSSIEHDTLNVGDAWSCKPDSGAARIIVVAVDSYPSGTAVNVVIELALDSQSVQRVLAPIEYDYLEPDLDSVVGHDVNVSEHLGDYTEWKRLANEGQAGVWTCTIAKVIETVTGANEDT